MNGIAKKPAMIQIKPEIRFGKPTIKGTRITVEDILLLLESGYRIEEIPAQYENVSLTAVKQALSYAASIVGKEEILSITS